MLPVAEAGEAINPVLTAIGQVLGVVVVIAGGAAFNHFKGNRRDKGRKNELHEQLQGVVQQIDERVDKRITRFQERVDDRMDQMDAGIAEVRSFCVGPDGKNGFRRDIEEIKEAGLRTTERLEGIDERERQRLERELENRRVDRRAAS